MTRLKHVSFITADTEAVKRFYGRLGASVTKDQVTAEGHRRLVLEFAGGQLQFFQVAGETPRPHALWAEHVALELSDMPSTLEQLRAAGVTLSRELSTSPSGKRMAFVLDPDGRQVELLQGE